MIAEHPAVYVLERMVDDNLGIPARAPIGGLAGVT